MTLSLAVIGMLFSLLLILVNAASISHCPPVRQRCSQQSVMFSQMMTERRSFDEFCYDKLSLAPLRFFFSNAGTASPICVGELRSPSSCAVLAPHLHQTHTVNLRTYGHAYSHAPRHKLFGDFGF